MLRRRTWIGRRPGKLCDLVGTPSNQNITVNVEVKVVVLLQERMLGAPLSF